MNAPGGGQMSKKEGLSFFVALFVVWVLVNPAVEVLLGEASNYVDALMHPPQLIGALVGSAVAAVVMYLMKNRSKESE